MNAKTFLLSVLAFILLVSAAEANSKFPPKNPNLSLKVAPTAKAPPKDYIPDKEAKSGSKKVNNQAPKFPPKLPPKGDDEIPMTAAPPKKGRDEL